VERVEEMADAMLRMPGRVVEIASGADIAARMLRMGRLQGPTNMHRVVAEAMTVRETSFFRDVVPFQVLGEQILPELIARRKSERRLRLWSAGCATGQEAYSLAMVLLDRFPELEEWDVRIVGTDISRSACAYARRGRYSRLEINRGLPARRMLRYFERDGEEWQVREELRRMVRFECADLGVGCEGKFDVVLLRNVLLYFSAEERSRVLAAVYARMRSRGVMLLGASEEACELFQVECVREQVFYRVVAEG
jgi:chemotaxis protein methyltransferase CheR